jgi:quercetin dioxygenase-like cupin family protein
MRAHLWILALGLGSPALPGQSLDPLVADPQHYKLEIENQWVRVIREHMAPREKMPMHQHPKPGSVIVFLTDRHNRLTAQDGTSQELRNQAGELMWSAASTHRSENLNNAPFEAVQIEPRQPGGIKITAMPEEPTDPVVIDPQHYKAEFENEYVRVLRVYIGPHEKLKMHKHPAANAVLVQLNDQNLRLISAGGQARESKYPAGMVRWVEAGAAHQDENLSDQPLRFIRVELKLSR